MPEYTPTPMYTKEQAGYVEHMDNGMHRCATCEHYTTGSCTLVLGIIEPYGGCNLYDRAQWLDDAP